MTTRCPRDGELFDDDRPMCGKHVSVTEGVDEPPPAAAEPEAGSGAAPSETGAKAAAPPPAPGAAGVPARVAWTTAECWLCGTPSRAAGNTECLNPACRRSLIPPALLMRFRDGNVELRAGQRAELGRQGPYSRLFRAFGNVSRRHCVVGVDADGRAWIEAMPTANGTFLNEGEIAESLSLTLQTGDAVRLALHAAGTVTLYSPPQA